MTGTQRLLLAVSTVVILAAAGGLLPLLHEWNRRTIRLLLAFGTGVLLGAAFCHMIPEAVEALGGGVGMPVLVGFLCIYVMERFVMLHPCEEEHCSFHHMGMAAFLGITLHALIDGFALGAGLSVPSLGLPVTLAILLHKLPASVSLTGILLHCQYPRRRIAIMAILFSFATPVGALLSWLFLADLQGETLLYAVAFSAGTFLAIATADLLPQIHSPAEGRWANLAALFAGILAMWVTAHGGHHDEAMHAVIQGAPVPAMTAQTSE